MITKYLGKVTPPHKLWTNRFFVRIDGVEVTLIEYTKRYTDDKYHFAFSSTSYNYDCMSLSKNIA